MELSFKHSFLPELKQSYSVHRLLSDFIVPQNSNSRDVVFLMIGTEEWKVWKTWVFINGKKIDKKIFN